MATVVPEVTTAIDAASRSLWTAASLVVWLGLVVAYPATAADEHQGQLARINLISIGIGPGIFVGVNHDEACAGIKTWAKVVLNEHENLTDVETHTIGSPGAICTALKNSQIDAVSVSTEEFLDLAPELQPDTVILEIQNRVFTVFPNS